MCEFLFVSIIYNLIIDHLKNLLNKIFYCELTVFAWLIVFFPAHKYNIITLGILSIQIF